MSFILAHAADLHTAATFALVGQHQSVHRRAVTLVDMQSGAFKLAHLGPVDVFLKC